MEEEHLVLSFPLKTLERAKSLIEEIEKSFHFDGCQAKELDKGGRSKQAHYKINYLFKPTKLAATILEKRLA